VASHMDDLKQRLQRTAQAIAEDAAREATKDAAETKARRTGVEQRGRPEQRTHPLLGQTTLFGRYLAASPLSERYKSSLGKHHAALTVWESRVRDLIQRRPFFASNVLAGGTCIVLVSVGAIMLCIQTRDKPHFPQGAIQPDSELIVRHAEQRREAMRQRDAIRQMVEDTKNKSFTQKISDAATAWGHFVNTGHDADEDNTLLMGSALRSSRPTTENQSEISHRHGGGEGSEVPSVSGSASPVMSGTSGFLES